MRNLNLITAKVDFRPQFQYIQLLEGNFYATDAHILLKVPFYEVFPTPLFEELTAKFGAEMYFSGENWKDSKAAKGCIFKFLPESDLIEIFDNKKSLGFLQVIPANKFANIGKFPNCEQVIHKPDAPKRQAQQIGINPDLLSRLYMANNKKYLRLSFYGESENSAIKVDFLDSDAVGILMPMLLDKFN